LFIYGQLKATKKINLRSEGNMGNKYTLVSDLQLNEVRCKIENFNKKGEKTYITEYNILGEKRMEVLSDLEEIVVNKEEINAQVFSDFYIGLIMEFTDIIMDKDDISFMLNEGNLTSKILMQEINDMIYELQYETAMNNLANVRNITLNMLSQASLQEMKNAEDRLKKENEKRRKLINHKVKKVGRRFIK
jgi:hypothetical protein